MCNGSSVLIDGLCAPCRTIIVSSSIFGASECPSPTSQLSRTSLGLEVLMLISFSGSTSDNTHAGLSAAGDIPGRTPTQQGCYRSRFDTSHKNNSQQIAVSREIGCTSVAFIERILSGSVEHLRKQDTEAVVHADPSIKDTSTESYPRDARALSPLPPWSRMRSNSAATTHHTAEVGCWRV
jgi:hypothetical protein